MKIISHRGNIDGRDIRENQPNYIDIAINSNFDVEIDCWMVDGKPTLGHDSPQYPIPLSWLQKRRKNIWIHCKDLASLNFLKDAESDEGIVFNYFFHQNDDYTLTSLRHFWTYPQRLVGKNSIIVLTGKELPPKGCLGVCTDYPFFVKKNLTWHKT